MSKTILFLIVSVIYLIIISVGIFPYYHNKGDMTSFLLIIAGNIIAVLVLAYMFKRQQNRKK